MKIAVASKDGKTVGGHAGRARRWLVYAVDDGGAVSAPEIVSFGAEMVFHNFADDQPHPLDGVTALIAASAGEGFLKRMARRGIDARLTSEGDPVAAVRAYHTNSLPPPKPRPVGGLLCKALDLLSNHR